MQKPEWRLIEQERIFDLPDGRHETYSVAGVTDDAGGITITREGRSRAGTLHFLVQTPEASFKLHVDWSTDTSEHRFTYRVWANDSAIKYDIPQIKRDAGTIASALCAFSRFTAEPNQRNWKSEVLFWVGHKRLTVPTVRAEDVV